MLILFYWWRHRNWNLLRKWIYSCFSLRCRWWVLVIALKVNFFQVWSLDERLLKWFFLVSLQIWRKWCLRPRTWYFPLVFRYFIWFFSMIYYFLLSFAWLFHFSKIIRKDVSIVLVNLSTKLLLNHSDHSSKETSSLMERMVEIFLPWGWFGFLFLSFGFQIDSNLIVFRDVPLILKLLL